MYNEMTTPQVANYASRHATLIHVGRKIPKELRKLGFMEKSAMHLGRGCWIISMEKKREKNPA